VEEGGLGAGDLSGNYFPREAARDPLSACGLREVEVESISSLLFCIGLHRRTGVASQHQETKCKRESGLKRGQPYLDLLYRIGLQFVGKEDPLALADRFWKEWGPRAEGTETLFSSVGSWGTKTIGAGRKGCLARNEV